jgi:beta-glucosidase
LLKKGNNAMMNVDLEPLTIAALLPEGPSRVCRAGRRPRPGHSRLPCVLALAISLSASAASASEQALDIRPAPNAAWGGAYVDVKKVLYSAAETLWPYFPGRTLKPMLVQPTGGPITLFRRGPKGEYFVLLNTGKRLWAQHAYQFAHEFTHILANYDEHEQGNKWFEESICETASLFALRRMSETWKTNPPYPNWKDYSPALKKYADDRIHGGQLPPGKTLAQWYRENDALLRKDPGLRDKNTIVAVALLPLFEKQPESWETITWLNDGAPHPARSFAQYLADWHARVPEKSQAVVRQIAAQFDIEINIPTSAEHAVMFESEAIDAKVAALLQQMTLAEKLGQLTQFSNGAATGPGGAKIDQSDLAAGGGLGSILNLTGAKVCNELQRQAVEKSRLKIPILFGLDVIHGHRTVYPIPLGLSAAWDTDLAQRCARMAAVEATADGIRWTFSPMVDIARDARWGRIAEGSGEDPYLGSVMAAAWVRGYQGKDLADLTAMLACAKHYVAYGAAEGGRDYNTTDVSERTLRDIYLPPFKASLDAGAGTFMSAFNSLNGVPASANRHTLTDILRDEWGFQGVVVSDWDSIGELVAHGVALDGRDAALKAITAGVDMDMQSNLYDTKLPELVKSGRLRIGVIDQSVARVLRLKFALGLFERPYTDEKRAAAALKPEHLELARQAAEASFVLLKNDPLRGKPLLPLEGSPTVALIGPLADDRAGMFGAWVMKADVNDAVTLRQSLAARLKERLFYAKGAETRGDSEAGFAEALSAARRADLVIMALGEAPDMSGEAESRACLYLPGRQLELLKLVASTGKPVVLIVFSGRPLALPWEAEHVPAILAAWFPGVQAGPALVRTLFGEVNPAGRLTATFPRSVGQMPLYYNHFQTGRPSPGADRYVTGYIDERNTPLFPFGWGLSYTKFEYSPTKITTAKIGAGELNRGGSIAVEAAVKNGGLHTGAEVVQLYISQRGTSVARPVRELKGYDKIVLAPGEERIVKFRLTKKQLAFWNLELQHTVEPGELSVWVSANSQAGHAAKIMIEP